MSATAWEPKEIRRFKIAVNSACPLRCDYCLLDKDAGETLSPEAQRRALELFLTSPGARKKLLIYGGEPLLAMERVRDVADAASARAAELGKSLCATVATSAAVMRDADLAALRARGMHLSISLDGGPDSHDRFRRFKDGRPSYARVATNARRALRALGTRAVTALMCVHPDNAARMREDFDHLAGLGFENVNVEVVHGVRWPPEARAAFEENLRAIGRRVREALAAGRFLFLESFAIPLQREPAAEKACPLHSCLEAFPDGTYSFYPFPFVPGLPSRPRVAVGSARDGLSPRYRDCRYEPASDLCRGCAREYYTLPGLSEGNEPYELRTRLAERWIADIALEARGDAACRRYLTEAVRRSAMGYR